MLSSGGFSDNYSPDRSREKRMVTLCSPKNWLLAGILLACTPASTDLSLTEGSVSEGQISCSMQPNNELRFNCSLDMSTPGPFHVSVTLIDSSRPPYFDATVEAGQTEFIVWGLRPGSNYHREH